MGDPHGAETIAFAEKLLLLLDQGSYTATYKFAVLLAMIDVVLERADVDGSAPDRLSSRALADKAIELYWPQTRPFPGRSGALVLRQNSGGQAAIVSAIRRFRDRVRGDASQPGRARMMHPEAYEELVDEVEWKLVQMPLPRLQVIGQEEERFIYDIDWDKDVSRSAVRSGRLDTTIRLRQEVGERLIRLSGLLRPLIHRQWAERVARFNRAEVPDFELEHFLFGVPRSPTRRLGESLRELQEDRCFYCAERLRSFEVDHFLPWARHPDDGIHNLVVAHVGCNSAKRDHLAARPTSSGGTHGSNTTPATSRTSRRANAGPLIPTAPTASLAPSTSDCATTLDCGSRTRCSNRRTRHDSPASSPVATGDGASMPLLIPAGGTYEMITLERFWYARGDPPGDPRSARLARPIEHDRGAP